MKVPVAKQLNSIGKIENASFSLKKAQFGKGKAEYTIT